MLGFEALDRIFNRPSLQVQQEQCLNNRHRKAGCADCIEACPAGALAYGPDEDRNDRLHVNLEQCTACGVCQGACPTGALSVSGYSPNTLLLKVKGKSRVAIACPRAADETALQVPCLAALDGELLALMGLRGTREIILQDQLCAACDRGGAPLILQLRGEVLSLSEPSGLDLQVRFASEGAAPEPAEAVENGEVFARRDLFTLFRRQVAEATSVLAADLVFVNRERPGGLPHRVSATRLKLLELLRQRPTAQVPGAGAATANPLQPSRITGVPLQIDAALCDGCGLCAAVCPAGAVSRTVQPGGAVTLEQQLGHCINCGLCLDTCPRGAIQPGLSGTVLDWLTTSPRQLVKLQAQVCSACGKSFTPTPLAPPPGLCPQCSAEKAMVDELFGGR